MESVYDETTTAATFIDLTNVSSHLPRTTLGYNSTNDSVSVVLYGS